MNTLLTEVPPIAGMVPSARDLADNGVETFAREGADPPVQIMPQLAALTGDRAEAESFTSQPQQLISVGMGFQALPKRLVERIRANEYIDFAELPPAKGKGRQLQHNLGGQVLVVQAAELLQSRKVIPDLATWAQCFAMYVAVLAPVQPERVPDLMAYQAIISKASTKYKWPSWIVYDQNFRQEMSGNPRQSWAKVDPSIYALSFTNQTISSENWCSRCQCLDHTTGNCPFAARKRPWSTVAGSTQQGQLGKEKTICLKFNKFDGDCKFGSRCRFLHACSACHESHPVSRCKATGEKSGMQQKDK